MLNRRVKKILVKEFLRLDALWVSRMVSCHLLLRMEVVAKPVTGFVSYEYSQQSHTIFCFITKYLASGLLCCCYMI
jgi:hypothetical protein